MKILDLYITDICNLNCEYCYVDVVKKEDAHFNATEFSQRIDLLSYDAIKFLWGEPLVKWNDIKDIIKSVSLKKTDINFTIITNGILLNDEKITFINSYSNIEVLISLHEWSLIQIRRKIDILLELKNNISLYIIFDPKDFKQSIAKFLEFSRYGFTNFCFAPEIYATWNQADLIALEKILKYFSDFILRHNISIWGIAKNYLKVMDYGCEKHIYNKTWDRKLCNRFRSLEEYENFNYKRVYDYFQDAIGYKQDPNRWFYVCPVGWYLDNKDNLEEKTLSYKKLNSTFLKFHKYINKNQINFLNPDINEVRFNLTRQCNIRCGYCYVDFKNETLSFTEAKNIVDFYLERAGDNITFSFFWWEPLLEKKLLIKIVGYIHQKNENHHKNIYLKIATNFMLVDDDIIDFLSKNDFEIHISLNGTIETNDYMRDNSSGLVLQKIQKYKKYLQHDNTIVLLAFSPKEITMISKNIEFIHSLWLNRINFELIFWKWITWSKFDIMQAVKNIIAASGKSFSYIENMRKNKNIFIDIDTKWRCNDNSLEFYWHEIDTVSKKYFDSLLNKIWKNAQ